MSNKPLGLSDRDEFYRLAKDVFTQIGERLVEQAVDNMDDYSHGRTYLSHGRYHTVSIRGQTANNDTGDLANTIRCEIPANSNTMKFGAGNIDVDYAATLEDRTKLDRPNYSKTVEQLESEIDDIVEASALDVLRRPNIAALSR